MITAEFIRDLLDYDPATGHFTYRYSKRGIRAGDRAGGLNSQGYRDVCINRRDYAEHRLVWLWVHGAWPKHTIDHINRDPSDNRLCNLREATMKQQNMNRNQKRQYPSGLPRGVKLTKSGRYQAQFNSRTEYKYLGTYDTPEEAHAVYVQAAQEAYGEFFCPVDLFPTQSSPN